MNVICSDSKRNIVEKTLTDELTLLRGILFDETNIFREKISADFQLMNQVLKVEYLNFARQALIVLLQDIAKDIDFSVEEKSMLKPLSNPQKSVSTQNIRKQEKEVKVPEKRKNSLATSFFEHSTFKSALKTNPPSQKRPNEQENTRKRTKVSVSFAM